MKEQFEFFENLDPELLGERPELSDTHQDNLQALREFESLCWLEVDNGRLSASDAEEAIWAFIEYIEQ